MRKSTISHKYLRMLLGEILEQMENTSDETFKRFEAELKHSCLIIAGDVGGGKINIPTVQCQGEPYALLFTDMDEFRKVFPDYEIESHENQFAVYFNMLKNSKLGGFIINLESECFFLPKGGFDKNEDVPEYEYPITDAYTSEELNQLKNQINNKSLEEFIENPKNIARYEELFDKMSDSTLLVLMLSRSDLSPMAKDGVISMEEPKPLGFLYTDNAAGEYAAVFTSEQKISNVNTPLNRYSQLVNFSYMVNFVLNDDMDGIIINPESDNVVLTRDILLEFSPLLDETCNNPKLNSAILHMFLMEA